MGFLDVENRRGPRRSRDLLLRRIGISASVGQLPQSDGAALRRTEAKRSTDETCRWSRMTFARR